LPSLPSLGHSLKLSVGARRGIARALEHRLREQRNPAVVHGSASPDPVTQSGRRRSRCKPNLRLFILTSSPLISSDLTSSTSALHISIYDRNKAGEGFLGMVAVKPVLKDGYCLDQWYKLGTRGTEHVTGELWVQVSYTAIRVGLSSLAVPD
jgi:hypothetical protein